MAKEVTYASPLEARAAASKSRTIDRTDDGPTKSQISQRQTRITSGDISDVMTRARGTWERLKAVRAASEDRAFLTSSADAGNDTFTQLGDPHRADLIDRFNELSSSQKRNIATQLNLLEQEEFLLPEAVRYDRFFARANERKVMDDVAAAVASMGK